MIKQFLSDVCWGELDYLIIDTPPGKESGKVMLNSFHWNGYTLGFYPSLYFVQHTKQYASKKVLLGSFHLNGHAVGFCLQT